MITFTYRAAWALTKTGALMSNRSNSVIHSTICTLVCRKFGKVPIGINHGRSDITLETNLIVKSTCKSLTQTSSQYSSPFLSDSVLENEKSSIVLVIYRIRPSFFEPH